MQKPLLLTAFLALILAVANPAFADSFFSFSYSGTDVVGAGHTASGSEIFTAQLDSPGVYSITGIAGHATYGSNTYAITGLLAPGTLGGNDNLLFVPPSPGYFDIAGVAFSLFNGFQEDLFSFKLGSGEGLGIAEANGAVITDLLGFDQSNLQIKDVTPTSATPEPQSLVLLTIGMLGSAGFIKRRFRAE